MLLHFVKIDYLLLSSSVARAHLLVCAVLQAICTGARRGGPDRAAPSPHELIIQTVPVRLGDAGQLLRAPRLALGLVLALKGVQLVEEAPVLDLMHPAVHVLALAEPSVFALAQEVVDERVFLGEKHLARRRHPAAQTW